MIQTIIFIVIGIAVGYYFVARGRVKLRGIVKVQSKEKEENIKRLKGHISNKKKITNNEVERFLGVSDATATRYLEELEREGSLEQIGREGRNVYYKVK